MTCVGSQDEMNFVRSPKVTKGIQRKEPFSQSVVEYGRTIWLPKFNLLPIIATWTVLRMQ